MAVGSADMQLSAAVSGSDVDKPFRQAHTDYVGHGLFESLETHQDTQTLAHVWMPRPLFRWVAYNMVQDRYRLLCELIRWFRKGESFWHRGE